LSFDKGEAAKPDVLQLFFLSRISVLKSIFGGGSLEFAFG
jgi:hypothetical protein